VRFSAASTYSRSAVRCRNAVLRCSAFTTRQDAFGRERLPVVTWCGLARVPDLF
jgi:hypothetical protein